MYEARNHLLICTEYADPEPHKHGAAHIMVSLDDSIEIIAANERLKCRGILIPSGMIHTANTNRNRVLVFLFDNTTAVAEQISTLKMIPNDAVDLIRDAYCAFENSDKSDLSYTAFFRRVLDCSQIAIAKTIPLDIRIECALTYIQSRLHERITCDDVAGHIFLSEGRFSHLFKEQVGMTFAAYLIYQRVIKTYTDLINGKSITDASLDAGFSSSAHFAETNKSLFGLSASIVKKNLEFYKIAEI